MVRDIESESRPDNFDKKKVSLTTDYLIIRYDNSIHYVSLKDIE